MAHHMGREFTGEFAAISESPQEFRLLSLIRQAHQSQIHFRSILDILEILPGTGNQKIFTIQFGSGKLGRNGTDHLSSVKIFAQLAIVKHQADVAAVTFIPTMVIHVGGSADKFNKKGSSGDIFHLRFLNTFSS